MVSLVILWNEVEMKVDIQRNGRDSVDIIELGQGRIMSQGTH